MVKDKNFAQDDFACLVGREFNFFGVCSNEFKLNSVVWEAQEDESDGYRSYLGSVVAKESSGIFFQRRLARVVVQEYVHGDCEGFSLVDTRDGHVWLVFGTDRSDDYYPFFVFDYRPKTVKSRSSRLKVKTA